MSIKIKDLLFNNTKAYAKKQIGNLHAVKFDAQYLTLEQEKLLYDFIDFKCVKSTPKIQPSTTLLTWQPSDVSKDVKPFIIDIDIEVSEDICKAFEK